jgi:hypothetical protein
MTNFNQLGSFGDFQKANPGAGFAEYDALLTQNKIHIAQSIGTTVAKLEGLSPEEVTKALGSAGGEATAA